MMDDLKVLQDRVARAMFNSVLCVVPFDEISPIARAGWQHYSRAAILEMRKYMTEQLAVLGGGNDGDQTNRG